MKNLPNRGFVFWPVGTGDSTTIAVTDSVVLQVDLNHLECANSEGDPHTPIVDRLEELLPKKNGAPYLSTFALSHPDQDHCRGFADLLRRVEIGELWFTPRVFREYAKELCDDAQAFQREAKRRVEKTIQLAGQVESGDRVRIVGYDDLLEDDDYCGFPKSLLTVPGNTIEDLDGGSYAGLFRTFVHAPFKDDSSGDRNTTSLGLQVTLHDAGSTGQVLLLGDLAYPTVRRIFTQSDDTDLAWNALLAPHHCSKSVMYWRDAENSEEELKQDILDDMKDAASSPGYIVASSEPIPASNNPGDNPPHAKAKNRYQEIVPDAFLCTQEHGGTESPEPIVFVFEGGDLKYVGPEPASECGSDLAAAVAAARGSGQPPQDRVGFG